MRTWILYLVLGVLIASIWGYYADLRDGNILSFVFRMIFILIGGYLAINLFNRTKKNR